MTIFKTKTYPATELVVLKICVMCAGLVLGAYFSSFVKSFLWIIAGVGAVTYLRAMYYYWSDKGSQL